MRGSSYPDGVTVDQVALQRTELTKAQEILRGRVDWTSRGIYSGGVVSVNTTGAPPYLRIDVTLTSGFAPNGEYIETDSPYYNIALSDYTAGTINYVYLVYTESNSYRQPHESDGSRYYTRADMAWRVRVYTAAQFAALPATDENLANDAQDRCLLVAEVSANGAGVSITSSNITMSSAYDNILYATPSVPPSIAGVTILNVSAGTSIGDGLLEFYFDGTKKYLRWGSSTAAWVPGAVPPGNGWIEITADSTVDLLDTSGEYIRVLAIFSELPTLPVMPPGVPLFEIITITNIYYQEIPRLTAEDWLHRSLLGTGTPTPTNPHGMSVDDLSGSTIALLDEHQDIMHSNGIWKGSSVSCMECTISSPLAGDQLNITAPGASDLYYINGKKLLAATPLSFMFIPTVIPSSGSGCHLYEVSVSDEGTTAVNLKMSFPDPRLVTGTWIVGASESYPAGSYNLVLTVAVPGITTYTFSWDGGEPVQVTWDGFVMESQVIRLYAADSEKWIDLLVNTSDAGVGADGTLPAGAGVLTSSITVYDSVDWSQNLQIASLCGWWNAAGGPARFQIGYKPYDAGTRYVVDTRKWGTLATDNMSDSALQELAYSPQDELHDSGVLYKRHTSYADFEVYGVVGLNINVRGGAYYCRGKRLEFAGNSLTLADNKTSLLYLDDSGYLQFLNVTDDFAGVVADAVKYVIGGTKLTPPNSDVYHQTDTIDPPERGVVLYEITTAAGVISSTVNLTRNVNGPVTPWSVAAWGGTALAMFDSLYSAFLYAGLLNSHGDQRIQVSLHGPSYVDSVVTQPLNVDVCGKLSGAIVSIRYLDVTGAWRLNTGSHVENVSVSMAVSGGTAIRLAYYVVVSGCTYTPSTVSDIFLYSSDECEIVHITKNKVSTRSSFITATNTGNYGWWVEDNAVVQTTNSVASSLINLSGFNIHIANNHLVSNNTSALTTAISGTVTGDYFIEGNTIEIGDTVGADTAYQLGIDLNANGYFPKVLNNTIKDISSGLSHVGVGIRVYAGNAVISGNNIFGLGGGIYLSVNSLKNSVVSRNNLYGCYHFGISVSPLLFGGSYTSVENVSVCDNNLSDFVYDAGGSALPIFGTVLYGIRVVGGLEDGSASGNVDVSGNNLQAITSSNGGVYGIFEDLSFLVAGGATGWEGLSIDHNRVKDIASATNEVAGIYTYLHAAAGIASTLSIKGLSISNNQVKLVASVADDAYGICAKFNLDSSHTTFIEGLNVDGNAVSGFYGKNDAANISAGIHLEDLGPFTSVFGVTCNGNTVGTVSANTTAPGTDNDSTYVYGIYSSLKNNVVANNNITITGSGGATLTARGDGIRLCPLGSTAPTLRSVVSGNCIQVNWTGIHLKCQPASDPSTYVINGNRISSGSVGIFLGAGTSISSIASNTVFVVAVNACEYNSCVLDGCGCIVNQSSEGDYCTISDNVLTMAGSLAGANNANIWMYQAENLTLSGNKTLKSGVVLGTTYHIYTHDCSGVMSVIGNQVDNSVVSGAIGIYVDNNAALNSVISVKGNSVITVNKSAAMVYELYVSTVASDMNAAHLMNNSLHLIGAANGADYPYVGFAGGHVYTELSDTNTLPSGTNVYTNLMTHDFDVMPYWW